MYKNCDNCGRLIQIGKLMESSHYVKCRKLIPHINQPLPVKSSKPILKPTLFGRIKDYFYIGGPSK